MVSWDFVYIAGHFHCHFTFFGQDEMTCVKQKMSSGNMPRKETAGVSFEWH